MIGVVALYFCFRNKTVDFFVVEAVDNFDVEYQLYILKDSIKISV